MSSFHTGGKVREQSDQFTEKTITVDRVSRSMAGGRRMRVRAIVLIGDGQGVIGVGVGKSAEYQDAMQKARASARRHTFALIYGKTIPRRTEAKYGSAYLILKPAPEGAGIRSSSVVRAVCELVGIENIVAKQLGSANKVNVLGASIAALKKLSGKSVNSDILVSVGI